MEAVKAAGKCNDDAPDILRIERYQYGGLEVELNFDGEPSLISKQFNAETMLRIGHSGFTELVSTAPAQREQVLEFVGAAVKEVLDILPQERTCAVEAWYVRTKGRIVDFLDVQQDWSSNRNRLLRTHQ